MKIIVIGESCKDVFVYGNCNRLSPEAPVPVMIPIDVKDNLGMSGNVVKNIQVLDSKVNIIHWHQKESITKTRYVEKKSNHMFLRVDEGEENITPFELNISKTNAIRNVDGVIISDYDKGFLEEEDIEFICKNNSNVFIDTKKILGKWCVNASFIKINHVEYQHTEYTIHELGIEDKMIITLSSKGCQHKGKIYPVEKVQIRDVSGAGDTFLSGLVAEYVLTKDIEKSIPFAQQCATVVVQKPGVSTI
jgi:D-beta-D-heptose 7-phosphate kinase/D-beta-D-heptose 1-phosphate adenosyltransferase